MNPHFDTDGAGIKVGRYLLHRQIARGGMATIHIARLMGDEGFSRIVAAKRLLPEFAEDSDFVAMFLDEARVASKVHHRNVVPVLDVVSLAGEVILVQEYVQGAPLNQLLKVARQARTVLPVNVAVAIAGHVLAGLHAAHDTLDEVGMPLNIVHRDVSPQNIMIATDGTARLLDFGVAKATMAAHVTRENAFKGKLAYSAPEQLQGAATRQSDVYSLSIVLWEMLAGQRVHEKAASEGEIVTKIMTGAIPAFADVLKAEREYMAPERWAQLELLEPVIRKGLAVAQHERFLDAAAMEHALAAVITPATSSEIAAWLKSLGKDILDKNDKMIAAEENSWRRTAVPGRLTPIPRAVGRLSTRMGIVDASTEVPEAPTITTSTEVRQRKLIIALGVIVLLLGGGFLFALRGASEPTTEAAPQPVAPQPVAPQPVATPAPTPEPAPVAAPPAPRVAPSVAPSVDRVDAAPAASSGGPPGVEPGPPAQRKRAVAKRPAKETKASVSTTPAKAAPAEAAAPEPAAKDCSPPYYFQGAKKIFKPECL